MHKYIKGLLPPCFDHFFQNNLVSDNFTKCTRSQSKFYPSFCRLNITKQSLRYRGNAIPHRESNNLPARSKQSHCPLCQQLFQLYKNGPRGWNTKPFIPCVLTATGYKNTEDATSLLKWILHHLNQAYKLFKSRRLRTLSCVSVRTNQRPNKCNMPLSAVHRNVTMQGLHYIFKDGQWATAHMREHPKVQVAILFDRAQAHGESTSVHATNVTLSLTKAPK